jgi:hypothetical protein
MCGLNSELVFASVLCARRESSGAYRLPRSCLANERIEAGELRSQIADLRLDHTRRTLPGHSSKGLPTAVRIPGGEDHSIAQAATRPQPIRNCQDRVGFVSTAVRAMRSGNTLRDT